MTAAERRKKIAEILQSNEKPVSAAALARRFDVSRQVIVGDVALLRASGADIIATPTGYIVARSLNDDGIVRTLACNHREEDLENEIYAIIDNGGGVLDAIVEHPIYGQLTGQLNLFSRYDADRFIGSVKGQGALLSQLTGGVHLHTIRCKDEDAYQRIISALERLGILLDKN